MSMLRKLSALFRGTAHDAAQGVVDANALKILDQEIRDADNAQGKARDDLAGLVAVSYTHLTLPTKRIV